MQPTQQPVQATPATTQKPAATAQAQQKPAVGQQAQPVAGKPVQPGQPVKKKPSKWWIWVIIAVIVVGGGVWAYFQFLR